MNLQNVHFPIRVLLRTVPTFASAHIFCTSQDGPRGSDFFRMVPTNSKVFKQVLLKSEKKIGVSHVFFRDN